MKSLGQVIKEARLSKNFSVSQLSESTKIKSSFLEAIEKNRWASLPEFPVLQGFIRSIGHTLDVDENKLVAVLRRDYPPKHLPINPKPDVKSKFTWGPRLTFVLGTLLVLFLIAGYLVYQYFMFVSPPHLEISKPIDSEVVKDFEIEVSGKTTQDATIKVNSQPFVVDPEGNFSGQIEITGETREIEVVATSRAGRETTIRRKIQVDL